MNYTEEKDGTKVFDIPTGIDKSKKTWTNRWGRLYQRDYCDHCGVDVIICPHCDMSSCSGTSCDHCNDDFTEWLSPERVS